MEILIYHPVLRSPRTAMEEAPALEALGFDGLVMPDHLYVLDFQSGVPLPYPHPLPVLAAAAAVTRRLKLLALVSNNLARGPVELAQQTATLANLAPGRVELALGAGWFEAEHVAAGVGFPAGADRVRRLVESVSICRRLFVDGAVDHQGEHYQVSVPSGGFAEVEQPIPIMVGAAAPAMIRAAARVADRVDLQPDALSGGGADLRQYNSYTFELLAAGVERAMAAAAAAGRTIRVERVALRPRRGRRGRRGTRPAGDGRLPRVGHVRHGVQLRHAHRLTGRGGRQARPLRRGRLRPGAPAGAQRRDGGADRPVAAAPPRRRDDARRDLEDPRVAAFAERRGRAVLRSRERGTG